MMSDRVIFEIFNGKDLQDLNSKAHKGLPFGYSYTTVNVQYLNNQWVVTTIAKEDEEQDEEL